MGNINVTPYAKPASTSGISLEVPPQTVNIDYSLYYHSDGRLDYSRILAELEKKCSMEMGIGVALLPRALHDPEIMTPLKDGIIVKAILVTKDILEMFDFHPESLGGETIHCHIPVKMKGSGMLWSIWACPGKGGGYDLDRLVNDLEDSYRKVLSLDSGEVIFSPAQRSVIRQNGTKWIEKLKGQYRNHLADKFNYSKEEAYRYKKIKSYSFPTGAVIFMQEKTPLASFTLSGHIWVRNNKLFMSIMGFTALLWTGGKITWNGSITLLKNGAPVGEKFITGTTAGIWPYKKHGRVPAGSVEFQLDPPDPKDKWQLKFDVGYNYWKDGSSDDAKFLPQKTLSVGAGWVKFPDAIWKIDREYEWLNPL